MEWKERRNTASTVKQNSLLVLDILEFRSAKKTEDLPLQHYLNGKFQQQPLLVYLPSNLLYSCFFLSSIPLLFPRSSQAYHVFLCWYLTKHFGTILWSVFFRYFVSSVFQLLKEKSSFPNEKQSSCVLVGLWQELGSYTAECIFRVFTFKED